jgi:hypothetical protein
MGNPMKIHSHNYTVKIKLTDPPFSLNSKQLARITERIDKLRGNDDDFREICSCENGVLRYESETLLPVKVDGSKQKVLLVFGNPATQSVKNGMFFFSRTDGGRHSLWGKLAKAGLVYPIRKESRNEEAACRREMILQGASSEKYLVGLTTFYSFPTPGSDIAQFSGVAGVEALFEPCLDKIVEMETMRVLRYPFTNGALIVFTQKSSCERFIEATGSEPLYWPIRGKGSGGSELAELLSAATSVI